MPIVADGQLNLAALAVSDVYVVVIPPQTPLIAGVPTDGIGLVGTASRGPLNTPIPVSDPSSLVRAFGDIFYDSTTPANSQYDLVTEALGAMKQGANNIFAVRVSDGTDVKATKIIYDNTVNGSGAYTTTGVTLTAASSGSWGNNISVQLGVGSNCTAVKQVKTITVAGASPNVSDTIQVTIDSTTITAYTIAASDVTNYGVNPQIVYNAIANAIANAINTNATTKLKVAATVAAGVVTITSLTPGSVGGYTITAAGGTGQGTRLTTVVAPVTTASGTLTYRIVIQSPYDLPEVFDNITATRAAIVSAINNGIVGIRSASAIVTAASTGSLDTIPLQTASAGVSGTDGRNGVTSSGLIGVDGVSRTGMYALRGLNITQFGIAGLTDSTQWPTMVSFAKDENMLAVLCLPQATNATSAVSTKNTVAIDDYRACIVKDFLWLNDTKNGVIRLVPPTGAVLGKIATLSPERSPGNKAIYGYLGTERTGYFNPNGNFVSGTPYGYAELALLEGSGIMFMTSPSPGGLYLSLRHGQNSSSNPGTNGINYSRMTIFLSESINSAMGFAIHEVHTPALRNRVRAALAQFLGSLADPGPGRSPMIGDVNGGPAFSIVCDATNNSDSQVALGYLNVSVQVKYLSIVRFFIISIEAGQSVTVKVQRSPIAAGV